MLAKKMGRWQMCHWPLAPRPAARTTGRDLATRTPTSEVPMTDSAHSMNLRGARLGVKPGSQPGGFSSSAFNRRDRRGARLVVFNRRWPRTMKYVFADDSFQSHL